MLACGHSSPDAHPVCPHLQPGDDYHERFTGAGIAYVLLCEACKALASPALVEVCTACRDQRRTGDSSGFDGEPGIVDEPSPLRFAALPPITPRVAEILDLRPVVGGDRDLWIGVTSERALVELDLDHAGGAPRRLATLPDALFALPIHAGAEDETEPPPLTLHLSRDGALAAVVQERHGILGVVVDLATGVLVMPLIRDTYHNEHCRHAFAFVEHGGTTLIVHATGWNRLDVHDPRTQTLLTVRGPTAYQNDEPPPHYLDYFHSGLSVSPDQRWIVDNGWVWQPVGDLIAWRIDHWLAGNVWESEDGPSRRSLCWRDAWDTPTCWLDGHRLAVWGYGQEQRPIAAVRIFDVDADRELSWFAGPRGELVFDRVLVSLDDTGTAVWSVERGSRLLDDPATRATRFHPTSRTFLRWTGSTIERWRLLGLDADLRTDQIGELADRIARERAWGDLPVLGDALESAGCTDAEMLAHCQQPGPHGDRCWVIDRLATPRSPGTPP